MSIRLRCVFHCISYAASSEGINSSGLIHSPAQGADSRSAIMQDCCRGARDHRQGERCASRGLQGWGRIKGLPPPQRCQAHVHAHARLPDTLRSDGDAQADRRERVPREGGEKEKTHHVCAAWCYTIQVPVSRGWAGPASGERPFPVPMRSMFPMQTKRSMSPMWPGKHERQGSQHKD